MSSSQASFTVIQDFGPLFDRSVASFNLLSNNMNSLSPSYVSMSKVCCPSSLGRAAIGGGMRLYCIVCQAINPSSFSYSSLLSWDLRNLALYGNAMRARLEKNRGKKLYNPMNKQTYVSVDGILRSSIEVVVWFRTSSRHARVLCSKRSIAFG